MALYDLTDAEFEIMETVRSLTIVQALEIQRSRDGKDDTYFVNVTTKVKKVIHSSS